MFLPIETLLLRYGILIGKPYLFVYNETEHEALRGGRYSCECTLFVRVNKSITFPQKHCLQSSRRHEIHFSQAQNLHLIFLNLPTVILRLLTLLPV